MTSPQRQEPQQHEPRQHERQQDRARGALYGLAIGDALGMPTQLLSRRQVMERWGWQLSGFEPAPPWHPVAAGLPAGAVTDDTEQAVLLARLLLSGPVDPREFANALVAWERGMAARGSLDLLGPSTRRAVDAVLAGTPPEEAGASGDTNGAAMRIAPVGILFPADNLEALVDAVHQVSLVTHNTSVALAGAAAVAAAVSTGVAGGSLAEATRAAVAAARLGAERGHWVAGADVADRILWFTDVMGELTPQEAPGPISSLIGTSLATQESVPAAFAVLSVVRDDPWRACLLAASLGGDSDTIAAMAGAIAGAVHGLSAFPPHAVAVIDAHGLGLADLADSLLALRR